MKLRNTVSLAVLAATMVAGCGGSGDGSMNASNKMPTVSAVPDQSVDQDTPLSVDFTVDDRDTGAASLMVEVAADGTTPYPADGLVVNGSGPTRTLTLTPLEATGGMASIAIRATDPQGAVTTRAFRVNVRLRNASVKAMALDTFAKSESDTPTIINGWTIQQDADDPAAFAALLGEG